MEIALKGKHFSYDLINAVVVIWARSSIIVCIKVRVVIKKILMWVMVKASGLGLAFVLV